MNATTLHLAIASGGTGGHFYPTLAIARAALRRGISVTLFVAGHHADEQLQIASSQGVSAVKVPAVRLPRRPLALLVFPLRFLLCVISGWRAVGRVGPDCVLGMGSFAAVPVCLGARLRRLPLVLHEGNSLMGRANRILSRWARAVATSLPLAPGAAPACPAVMTGMPLREALIEAAGSGRPTAETYREFGLEPGEPTVLVFGGSQGAAFINELVSTCVSLLPETCSSVQVIHLTGSEANDAIVAAYRACGVRAAVRRAEAQIERCYLAAGLVVCRGGASSLSELALFAKPAIIVPLPTAADDHQSVNARVLAARGALQVMPQSEATAERLAQAIAAWVEQPAAWEERGRALGALAAPDAAERVVDLVQRTVLAEKGAA